jgi:hypothetical protein
MRIYFTLWIIWVCVWTICMASRMDRFQERLLVVEAIIKNEKL